jgi:hypothetical protein
MQSVSWSGTTLLVILRNKTPELIQTVTKVIFRIQNHKRYVHVTNKTRAKPEAEFTSCTVQTVGKTLADKVTSVAVRNILPQIWEADPPLTNHWIAIAMVHVSCSRTHSNNQTLNLYASRN